MDVLGMLPLLGEELVDLSLLLLTHSDRRRFPEAACDAEEVGKWKWYSGQSSFSYSPTEPGSTSDKIMSLPKMSRSVKH